MRHKDIKVGEIYAVAMWGSVKLGAPGLERMKVVSTDERIEKRFGESIPAVRAEYLDTAPRKEKSLLVESRRVVATWQMNMKFRREEGAARKVSDERRKQERKEAEDIMRRIEALTGEKLWTISTPPRRWLVKLVELAEKTAKNAGSS